MRRRSVTGLALGILLVPRLLAVPQDRYARVVEGILSAWKTADVVCLGEDHGRQYDSDVRIALVRHPAFPKTARVIAVEMANPIHQDLLDTFILEGAGMTRAQLAPIWRDASGAEVWESPIYEQFLRAVHDVNLKLSRDTRVRVIGGDSRIDWTKITRVEELAPLMNRGGNIRNIISKEILDANLKGLAIYGAGHCSKLGGGFPGDLWGKYPASRMWSIWTLDSRQGAAGGLGKDPAYVAVAGTKWASAPMQDGGRKYAVGDLADALVYHGDVPDVVVPADLTELKTVYGAELARRSKLIGEAIRIKR
jgi:hypothetical protein